MFRRKNESNSVALVRQKRLAALQRFQHAAFALHSQVARDAAMFCHQNHQRFRLMRIEMVKHKIPARLRVGCDDVLNILDKIFFLPRLMQHRCNDLAGRNILVAKQTRRTVTFVIIFATLDLSRSHRLGFRFTLQRLNAGLFINTDRVDAVRFVF